MNTCHIPAQTLRISSKTIDTIPGDKSISHRCVILGSLTKQTLIFPGFLQSEDCLNTVKIFQEMGVPIQIDHRGVTVNGVGLHGLKPPKDTLDVGNSGTGIRLIAGVLSGQPFDTTITGDESIQKRPMGRIVSPLCLMGAEIACVEGEGAAESAKPRLFPPLNIKGGSKIKGIDYLMPMASAQVKSAILLAGLFGTEKVSVTVPGVCRDHTERMLTAFGVDIDRDVLSDGLSTTTHLIPNGADLKTEDTTLRVPGDFSSAMFLMVLGLLLPESELEITHIGLNPTRDASIQILKEMGAMIEVSNEMDSMEPYGDIKVESSYLRNMPVNPVMNPIVIDEFPVLAVAAAFGSGTFTVESAGELRVKESDRIKGIVQLMDVMGVSVTETANGFSITGSTPIKSFTYDSQGDHRLAMSAIVAALASGVEATITNCDCIKTSFPNFFEILEELGAKFSAV
ncbi:3-phosphoshikimate 1-carboxyvinyltransferase [bacterium]|nr:3-phosphoshikimate 1-carboxyvinyltransferase [bacterium]